MRNRRSIFEVIRRLFGWITLIMGFGGLCVVASESNHIENVRYFDVARRTVTVEKTGELVQALNESIPGDVIVVRDGVYDGNVSFVIENKRGTEEMPIVIASETIGGAEIAGSLQFVFIDSSHVIIEGFYFSTTGGGSNPRSGRTTNGAIIIYDSQHIRVTRNHFELADLPRQSTLREWITIGGEQAAYNRVDHNLFENQHHDGSFITINKMASDTVPTPLYTRIDHNHFRDMGDDRTYARVARIGPGPRQYTPIDAHTVFEYNLIERKVHRGNIMTIKASGNTIRYNTFLETAGSLTIRHGDRNLIYGNYFIGNGRIAAGGVRMYGKDNRIYNNYFEGLGTVISLGNGGVEHISELDISSVTGYVRLNGADIAFNTFIDNERNIVSTGRDGDTLTPLNTRIANNIFYSGSNRKHVIGNPSFPEVFDLEGPVWEGNIAWGPGIAVTGLDHFMNSEMNVIDPDLTRNIEGVYYIHEHSAARNAGIGPYPYVTTDIEGKRRSEMPDVGSFEYVGSPLLRGPLTPTDVGPYASNDLSGWDFDDTVSVHITDVRMTKSDHDRSDGTRVMTVTINGVVTGPDVSDRAHVVARIGEEVVFQGAGFPATFTLDIEEFHAKLTGFNIEACIENSRTVRTAESDMSGTVKDEEGRPVGAIISLDGQHVMTDEYGRFDFGLTAYGEYELVVLVGGAQVYVQSVVVGETETYVPIVISMAGADNLIPNPGWEGAPSLPVGWRQDSSRSGIGEILVFRTNLDEVGTWVLNIDDPDDMSHALKIEKLPTRPGATYVATVTARTDGRGGRATLYFQFFDDTGKRIDHVNKHYTGAGWSPVSVSMVAPEDAVSMDVMLYSSAAIVGNAYFRNVKLQLDD